MIVGVKGFQALNNLRNNTKSYELRRIEVSVNSGIMLISLE